MSKPRICDDPMYMLLRNEDIAGFNEKREQGEDCDLSGCDFRGLDLRGLNAEKLNMANSYFRSADLRGIDFRNTDLSGASLAGAKISGCYFPEGIPATDIRLSVEMGTRLRAYLQTSPPA